MHPETIEVKNSKDALNAMKYAVLIFFIGVILVIFLAGKVSNFIFEFIKVAFIYFPLLVIIACILFLRDVPLKIELYPDRIHFIYWKNISNKPPNVYWIDVVYFKIFGELQDRFGNTINLRYLSKTQYQKIQQYLEQALRSMDERPLDYQSPVGFPVFSNLSSPQFFLSAAPTTHTENMFNGSVVNNELSLRKDNSMIKEHVKHNTGALLYEAETDASFTNGEGGIFLQKLAFGCSILFWIVGIPFSIALFMKGVNTMDWNMIFGAVTMWIVMALLVFLDYVACSFSVDRIYERGVTSFVHTFIDYLRGYTFHPWENITKIEYGEYKDPLTNDIGEFIVIHEAKRPKAVTSFHSTTYANDFFEQLKAALMQNCPNAEWVPRKQETLPFKLR